MTKRHNQSRKFLRYIANCDRVVTTKIQSISDKFWHDKNLSQKLIYIRQSYDSFLHKSVNEFEPRVSYARDILFVGSYEMPRANVLHRILDHHAVAE